MTKTYQKKANKQKTKSKRGSPSRRELFLLEPKTLFALIAVSFFTMVVVFFGEQGVHLMTSVLTPVPAHEAFDGTVYPVDKVPNWVKLTEAERKANYKDIPSEKFITVPAYNAAQLATSVDSLKWGNAADDAIRNAKITYSVPYLGNYELDGVENGGSHPAVDIKVPEGTPVRAIANGTVVKAVNSSSGFGNHIVLQHNNVPSEGGQGTTTLLSSYSHMSSLSISVNDVVKKGQIIGYSGSTGTATTPHIHFQIDSLDAPFHPYWPFTSSEMNANGYSFFSAINAGLGKSNAAMYTINPLKYVQKFLGAQTTTVTNTSPAPTVITQDSEQITFIITASKGSEFRVGDDVQFVIQAFDKNGSLLSNPKFKEKITLSLRSNTGTLNRTDLASGFFKSGVSSIVKMKAERAGTEQLIVKFKDREFSSTEFVVKDVPVNAATRFDITFSETNVSANESVAVNIRAYNGQGNQLTDPAFEQAPILRVSDTALATLSNKTLQTSNFSNGTATVNLTAKKAGEVTVFLDYKGVTYNGSLIIEAQKVAGITSEESGLVSDVPLENVTVDQPTTSPFTDIGPESPLFNVLTKLKDAKMVAGYGDGTFRPEQEVTRAEATTFIIRAMNVSLRDNVQNIFPDVRSETWYVPYVTTAYGAGFARGNPDGTFRPESVVNLAEFLTMLFAAAKADIDPQILIDLPAGIEKSEWFAPYIQEAIKRGLVEVPVGSTLDPGTPMTRGEIAKLLWKITEVGVE